MMDTSIYSSLMRWSTAFLVLHSAAEGSFVPFLAIYFRQLGLSAWAIGILLSIKILVGTLFGPLWRYFSRKYSKQKVLLILSIIACILFRIGLSVLPTMSLQHLLEYCANGNLATPEQDLNNSTTVFQNILTTHAPSVDSSNKSLAHNSDLMKREISKMEGNVDIGKTSADEYQTADQLIFGQKVETFKANPHIPSGKFHLNVSSGSLDSMVKSNQMQMVQHESEILKSNVLSMEGDPARTLLIREISIKQKAIRSKWRDKERNIRSINLRTDKNQLEPTKNLSEGQSLSPTLSSSLPLFLSALMVIILGEMFASSAGVLVRDSLYHHLDDSDNLEQFPQTMTLCSVSCGVSAALITALVDHIPCVIFGDKSSLIILILCSSVFVLASLLVAVCLPIFQPHSLLHTSSRAYKALRYLFSDIHHIFLILSCILLGFLSSAAGGFLFWHIQDLGGSQFSMGFYLTLESFSQGIIHLKYMWILRKLNHFGIFSLSLMCVSLMYFYFGVIRNPWMALLVAPLGAVSFTLFWKAVSDFLEKSSPPGLYLAMYKQSQIFHATIGLFLGYMCVGLLGDAIKFKLVFVFWGILALAGAGAMLLVERCLPREESFHYSQLFHSKGGTGNSEDEVEAEDWLEKALDDEEEL